jgi:hypothetical protein
MPDAIGNRDQALGMAGTIVAEIRPSALPAPSSSSSPVDGRDRLDLDPMASTIGQRSRSGLEPSRARPGDRFGDENVGRPSAIGREVSPALAAGERSRWASVNAAAADAAMTPKVKKKPFKGLGLLSSPIRRWTSARKKLYELGAG